MNEFVKAGVNGTLVTVEKYLGRHDGYYWSESICDVGSLTKAMQLYLNNERLYQQQKVASRLIAESELDWTKNSACLNQIFQNCLNKRKVCSQEVISLAERLDRLMAPSLFYRLLSLCRDYGKFSLDVLKK
jgi:predicted phosphohydrolase